MLINELLTLMDREAEMLAEENNHSAAALMRCGAAKIRELSRSIENTGESCSHSLRRSECTACEPLARLNHR